jgi:hypothetical protein
MVRLRFYDVRLLYLSDRFVTSDPLRCYTSVGLLHLILGLRQVPRASAHSVLQHPLIRALDIVLLAYTRFIDAYATHHPHTTHTQYIHTGMSG